MSLLGKGFLAVALAAFSALVIVGAPARSASAEERVVVCHIEIVHIEHDDDDGHIGPCGPFLPGFIFWWGGFDFELEIENEIEIDNTNVNANANISTNTNTNTNIQNQTNWQTTNVTATGGAAIVQWWR